jgi:uncharacterized protein YjdB
MKHKLLLSLLCLTISALSAQAQITLDTEHLFNIKYYAVKYGESEPANWQSDDFDDSGWKTYTGELEFPDSTTFYFRASFYLFSTPPYCNWYTYGDNCDVYSNLNGTTINNWMFIGDYLHQGKNTLAFSIFSPDYFGTCLHTCSGYFSFLVTDNISNYFASVPKATCVTLSESKTQLYSVDNTAMSTDTLYASLLTPDSIAAHTAITWSSSDPEIATVDNGIIKAVAAGDATITASAIINGEKFSSQCNVNVKEVDSDAKVVYVETAGTLSTLLTEDEKDNTTKLIVAGNLNSEDIKVLRYMAGRDENGSMTVGMLKDLDMSLATGIDALSSGANGFSDCNSLKKIVLPKSVTSLYYAFYGCENLEEVVLQEGLTSIGYYSFQNCSKLKSINIPSSVTSIDYGAFQICNSLTKTEFASVESLCSISMAGGYSSRDKQESNPLYYSHHLYIDGKEVTDLVIPNTVTNIGECLFYGCNNLTSVTFEEGSKLTSIGNKAFNGCSNLTAINIPSSVTNIGSEAFLGCAQIKFLEIPASVVSIGDNAFVNCTSLVSINVSTSNRMFSAYDGSLYNHNGDSLIFVPRGKRTVTLSDKTTRIVDNAFVDNAFGNYTTKYIFSFATTPPTFGTLNGITPSSVSVYVPKGTIDTYQATNWNSFKLAEIADKPTMYLSESNIEFYDLKIESLGTKSIYSSIVTPTSLSDATVTWSSSDTGIATVENGLVKAVAAGNATITASAIIDGETYTSQCNVIVKAIDTDAKVVYVETAGTLDNLLTEDEKANTKKLIVVGNINSNDITVLRYMAGRDASDNMTVGKLEDLDMSLATGISSLSEDDNGFEKCNSLKKIILPKSVAKIYDTFYYCENLEEVVLQEGLTSIGYDAFDSCSKLKSINIPASVRYIGGWAFKDCNSLTKTEFASIESLCSINMNGNDSNPLHYSHHLYIDGKEVTDLVIPNTVTSIGKYLFFRCNCLDVTMWLQ